MPDEYDSFRPGTGLFEGEATITSAVFTQEAGRDSMTMVMELDTGDSLRYGCGSGWTSYDGGESVEHAKGPRQLFSNQTAYSDFMVHASEAGARDVMVERSKAVEGQGAKHGSTWVGMRFKFQPLERPIRARYNDLNEDGTPHEKAGQWYNSTTNRSLPVEFLGVQDGQSHAGASPAPSGGSARASDPLSTLDAVTAAKVRKAAADSPDYNTFVDACLVLTDAEGTAIMENMEIGQALSTPDWYLSLRG